jgi:hypothetical protein
MTTERHGAISALELVSDIKRISELREAGKKPVPVQSQTAPRSGVS